MAEQRIDILPIGTRIKMAPFGEGVVRQASVSIDDETVVKHCVRFNDGFIAWAEDLYGGPTKVLSRPARKVTLVIEEETE